MKIRCAHCGKRSDKPNGAVNRAAAIGAPLFCDRTCAGLARRKGKTKAQRVEGSGHETCHARGCKEKATGFNDDGEALCEDCLAEWVCEYADD